MAQRLSILPWSTLMIAWVLLLGQYLVLADDPKVCKTHPRGDDPGCSCETDSGFVIDLSNVDCDHKSSDPCFKDVPGQNDKYVYSYDPCTPMTAPAKCLNAMICQNETYNVGNKSTAVWAHSADTYSIQYVGEGGRTSVISLECSEKTQFVAFGETKPLDYTFTLHTPAACHRSANKKGLSTGSILCILLLVFVIVYLVGGILFLHFVRGAQGVEMIPNYEFWKDFPVLVKDGTLFAVNGCKSDRTYEEI